MMPTSQVSASNSQSRWLVLSSHEKIRIVLLKAEQSRDQPADGNRDIDLDCQVAGEALAGQQRGSLGQSLESVAHERIELGAGFGQFDPPGVPSKQPGVDAFLEPGDLMADRRLRNTQFLRGTSET